MEEGEIQSGVVKAIHEQTDAANNRVITVDVQSLLDFSIIKDVALDSPLFAQYVPVVGQIVLVQKVGYFFRKIIGYYGQSKFNAPIKPGEALLEGYGGGFIYLNNGGDVILSDETLSNVIRILNSIGITVTADAVSLNVKGVGQLNITPQSSDLGTQNNIEFIKYDNSQKVVARFTITDDKIAVDGPKVEIGLQTNPIEAGTVISLAPTYGTYSVDTITGRPIPRAKNATVKISPVDHTQLT